MQLNDGHVFCTPDQAAGEASGALAMIRQAYAALGIEPARYRLSLPGPGGKYTGDKDSWERAAAMLAAVLDHAGLAWEEGPGEAAFYGPKIDVQVADSAERDATLSTIQVDFYQPERFGLQYTGPTAAGTARSWCTAASWAAWSGRSRICWSGTALAGMASHVAARRASLWDATRR
jgi:threonyl-tRNA synthetase